MFFTGHSLGGWVRQITIFTTKYLKIEGNNVPKIYNVPLSYSHKAIFDIPHCKIFCYNRPKNLVYDWLGVPLIYST